MTFNIKYLDSTTTNLLQIVMITFINNKLFLMVCHLGYTLQQIFLVCAFIYLIK